MTARVLVVDDVELNVKLLEAKLASEYFEVVTAYNGADALDLAEAEPPDIILLDVMMPRMDGFEVCRRLKANERTTDIPAVMVTALSDVADRLRGLEAGADDFLTKPVNDIALFARVRSLVRLKRMMEELRLREVHSAPDLTPLAAFDGLKVLTVDGTGDLDLRPLAGRAGLQIMVSAQIRPFAAEVLGPASTVELEAFPRRWPGVPQRPVDSGL